MSTFLYWLQILSSISVIFSFVALAIYAYDTNRMKREMLRQGTASRRPFLTVESSDQEGQFAGQVICNVGQGVAYNVSWKFSSDNPYFPNVGALIGSMAVGMRSHLQFYDGKMININMVREVPVRILYEDSAGKKYWSDVKRHKGIYVVETGEIEKT